MSSLPTKKQLKKECTVCGKYAPYYWNKASGEKLKLCFEHYEAMEREVHLREKQTRLLTTVIGVISGREANYTNCPNGEDCKYCKEANL